MKISDVRKHLSKALTSAGFRVYSEDISKITRPCVYLQLISSAKTSLAHYREKRKVSFDVMYLPSKAEESCNCEIQDALEEINLAFEDCGNRVLKVLDRYLLLENVSENITDNMGHFIFDVEFVQQYGKEQEYDLMQKIKIELGGE